MISRPAHSITTRLTRMNMLVSGVALLLACTAFIAYDLITFRDSLIYSLSIQAQIIGSNSTSALVFDDPRAAERTLTALKASPDIVSAGILTADGKVFARYSATQNGTQEMLPAIDPEQEQTYQFDRGDVVVVRSIRFNDKTAGHVYIRSDLRGMYALVKRYITIACVVLLTSLFVALLLSSIIRKSTAEPIVRLSEIAQAVSREKNYSIRAKSLERRGDELSVLVQAFNEMLARIEFRDRELQEARERLEERVEERTTQLAATNRELEAFSFSVSHDLRAPLRHIAGFSGILMEDYAGQMDPAGRAYLQKIQNAVGAMDALVHDLLGLARLGRQEPNRAPTDLNPIVRSVIDDLEQETKDRRIEWKIEELPVQKCDGGLVKLVFANLLSNAVKYSRRREPAVIEVGSMKDGQRCVIYVRDNGVGFDGDHAEKLFGVFQRLHRATEFEGTGVGLATARRIIEKHGGEIWAHAQVDKGATFFFFLERKARASDTSLADPALSQARTIAT